MRFGLQSPADSAALLLASSLLVVARLAHASAVSDVVRVLDAGSHQVLVAGLVVSDGGRPLAAGHAHRVTTEDGATHGRRERPALSVPSVTRQRPHPAR